MYDRPETTDFWWGRLPHWEVVDGRYFVTMRVSGTVPPEGQRKIRDLAQRLRTVVDNGQEGLMLQRRIFITMEKWLDRGTPSAFLAVPAVAKIVTAAIRHRHQTGIWKVYDYVIMPTHIHMFLKVLDGRLKSTMKSFKRWTGTRAYELVRSGRERFWQREWLDRWSRSPEEDEKVERYIRENPVKAGLVRQYRDWPYGSWHE